MLILFIPIFLKNGKDMGTSSDLVPLPCWLQLLGLVKACSNMFVLHRSLNVLQAISLHEVV